MIGFQSWSAAPSLPRVQSPAVAAEKQTASVQCRPAYRAGDLLSSAWTRQLGRCFHNTGSFRYCCPAAWQRRRGCRLAVNRRAGELYSLVERLLAQPVCLSAFRRVLPPGCRLRNPRLRDARNTDLDRTYRRVWYPRSRVSRTDWLNRSTGVFL